MAAPTFKIVGAAIYIKNGMRKFIYISLFFLTLFKLSAQNEANNWYFNEHCGLDFSSGIPEVKYGGQTYTIQGNATISDSAGNLLFYSDGFKVFNKSHQLMLNGDDLIFTGASGRAIVKSPADHDIYYIFTVGNSAPYFGLYYSIVDMKLDNGLGAVVLKEVPVELGSDCADRIAIVKKESSENIWIIARKFIDDAFATYLLSETGFDPDPIITTMPDKEVGLASWGFIKISYDKKYLLSSISFHPEIEVCGFNPANGTVEYMYTLEKPGGLPQTISGMEFSPDSKLLYISYYKTVDTNLIYQFEMQYINDLDLFNNSALLVGTGGAFGLQLARDGKIYCNGHIQPEPFEYVNVINNPWIRGEGCDFDSEVLDMSPGEVGYSLPNILLDYLYRFEWTGEPCQGYPIHFKPNFIPTPDSIVWNFGELAPGSTSTELSPTYAFKYSGVHEVKVDVWYPSGRYEHTSREIEILPSPQPDLGQDTLMCKDASITLSAGCDADFFSWSTGQFGVSSITVSDTGTYWVRATFSETGCEGFDTIHIGFHPSTTIDETNLVITPTSCSGASGSITGLTALGPTPHTFQWLDLSGNPFGANIDATGLPAGQYYLTITDGNDCETESRVYIIEDAGNLQVAQVQTTRPHCFHNDGQIIISAFSPSGSLLEYSIDGGNSFQADSIFNNLPAGSYLVHIRDINDCNGFYLDNPVILEDIPGPQVTLVNIINETDFLGNGAIEIIANGSTPVIYYSIDGGVTYQSNNGTFNNLEARIYYLVIKDENGCDTSFSVVIQNIILTYLHAITGEGRHCFGTTALVPIKVDNFNSVANFHLKLNYNADNLQCEGFANVHPQLVDSLNGWMDQSAGDIHLTWNSLAPVTFTGSEKVADLVFTTKSPGQGELAWYTGGTDSYFTNSSGYSIPAEFQTGEVKIYDVPEIILVDSKTFCLGDMVSIMSIAIEGEPPYEYEWTFPDGLVHEFGPDFFSITLADAGIYTLLVTDQVGCTDQKSIELIVSENPVAAFHGIDTLEMQAGDVLDAGAGMFTYSWNTGDTIENIIVYTPGMYTVEMESLAGCLGSDSVYVKLVSEEIPDFDIYIPNAFSPNGDGINDIFQIKFPNSTFNIQNSTLSIYDRWGGLIVETDGIVNGWDGKKNGKDCPGGVYVYKIVFSVDGVAGNQERVGVVMLVR